MSLEVRYLDIPAGAQAAAMAESGSSQPFSSAQQAIAGAEDVAWASLEPGSWRLDGSRRLLEDAPRDVFWWSSARSGADGCFEQPPSITITFPAPYTATGLSFTFCPAMGQWCSRLKAAWYNGQTLLSEQYVQPDNATWILEHTVEYFDRIELQFLQTNLPGQFAKLQMLQIGRARSFGKDELVRVQLLCETDPALCELSVDTMKIEIRDRNARSLLPQENQKMELYKDGKLIAAQYVQEGYRETRGYYTFSCRSVIGLLEQTYLGGMYEDVPLDTLLGEVLGEHPFQIHRAFSGVTLRGYLQAQTQRQALQQIAFAVGAMVTTQGDGIIHLAPLQVNIEGSFTGNRIFSGAKVKKTAQVGKVELYSHSYVPVDQEECLLDNQVVSGEGVLFVFSQPHHSYTISGGTIDSSGVNWVRITAAGEVTLLGKKYLHNTSVHTRVNPAATAAEQGNAVTVEAATLVHAGNVQQALDRLFTAQKLTGTLTQDAVISGQRAGQKISSENPWGTATEGYITRMDSTFTQSGQTAEVTIRGVEVALKCVFYYAGELFAGDEEVPY